MTEVYHDPSQQQRTRQWDFAEARKAQRFHKRWLLQGHGDVDQMAALMMQMYPKCYIDQFQSSGDEQYGAAMRFICGKVRQSLNDPAGRGGRVAVETSGFHSFGTVFPADFGLDFGDHRAAQFDPLVIDLFQAAFAEQCDGPYLFRPERGEKFNKKLHAHFVTAPGASSIGWQEIRGPHKLLDTLEYIHKLPWYEHDNIAGHAEAYRERNGANVKRLRSGRLGHAVSLADVQRILPHLDLLRPRENAALETSSVWNSNPVKTRFLIAVGGPNPSPSVLADPSVELETTPSLDSESAMVWSNATKAKPAGTEARVKRWPLVPLMTANGIKMLPDPAKLMRYARRHRTLFVSSVRPVQRSVEVAEAAEQVPLLAPKIRFDQPEAQTAPTSSQEPQKPLWTVSEVHHANAPPHHLFGALPAFYAYG